MTSKKLRQKIRSAIAASQLRDDANKYLYFVPHQNYEELEEKIIDTLKKELEPLIMNYSPGGYGRGSFDFQKRVVNDYKSFLIGQLRERLR